MIKLIFLVSVTELQTSHYVLRRKEPVWLAFFYFTASRTLYSTSVDRDSHGILKALFKLQDSHILHSVGDCRKKYEARVILTPDSLSAWVLGTKLRTFSACSYDPETNEWKIVSVGIFFMSSETLHICRFYFRMAEPALVLLF